MPADLPPMIASTQNIVATLRSSVMVTMGADGSNVKIDWAEVEKQAAGNDGYLRPLAKALIAARDNTREPIR